MQETLLIIRTNEELDRAIEYVKSPDFDFAAVDTETTGVEKDCEIVGLSVSCEEDVGIYVVLAEWKVSSSPGTCPDCEGRKQLRKKNKETKKIELVNCAKCAGSGTAEIKSGELIRFPELYAKTKELIEVLKTKRLIMHNSPFDCEVIERAFGIQLKDFLHTDTMELAHVLDENESAGLKEVASRLFGEDARKEQTEMKASVIRNGGIYKEGKGPKAIKELYKADWQLLGKYGAKDTILTLRLFYTLVPELFEQGLDKFFYEDESMPLMRGPTYQLNTGGLKLDVPMLKALEKELTDECARLRLEVQEAISKHTKEEYPNGFGRKKGQFNIGSSQQMAWLLFGKLGNEFRKLTDGGREVAKDLVERIPYNASAKRAFIRACKEAGYNPYKYMKCDKDALIPLARKYEWVQKLLKYSASGKILKTYCIGIQSRSKYGVIHPSFLQHGTTSGRYSSSNPNFQNLPRDDKRIKKCIIARPGRVFVGADYSQLEPRVFASTSQDEKLMGCFARGEDFYSVVGIPIFKDFGYSAFKKHEKSWAVAFEHKRNISKAFALATPYGTTAYQQADKLRDEEGNNLTPQECQEIIDAYFANYPSVEKMMLESHELAKKNGVVHNLFGRPRRIPDAKRIRRIYGDLPHSELPYQARTFLNLAMNHRVQSTAASIVNRAMIRFHARMLALGLDAKIVLQIHDEIVVECREEDAEIVKVELKLAMETTVTLPGVALVAEPKVAKTLAELK